MAKKQTQQPNLQQIQVSSQDFNDTLLNRDILLSDYALQENVLLGIFEKYPNNTNLSEVLLKTTKLNTFYSTGILDIKSVSEHICNLANTRDIDARIKSGDPSVVNEIAKVNHNGKIICHLSFASKYCSFHNPDAYPIYDSIVWHAFTVLKKKGFLSIRPFSEQQIKADFKKYIDIYEHFILISGINNITPKPNYKDVDRYLWGSQKIKKLPQNTPSIQNNLTQYNQIMNNTINKNV